MAFLDDQAMEPFLAHDSRWRLAPIALGALLLTAGALFMTGVFVPGGAPLVVALIGWVGTAFFGLAAAIITGRLVRPKLRVRVDAKGILSTSWSDQVIPWRAIAHVSGLYGQGQPFIVLTLRDPERFPGRGFAAWVAKANRAMDSGHIWISLLGTDRTVAAAGEAIAEHRGASRRKRG